MELLLLLSALCSRAASGTAPPACSGNGQRLSDGAGLSCSCRKPWTGPDCAVLGLAPARVRNGFGQDDHSSVSWGAGVVFHPEDSLYHMYVLEVLHNCPLCTFGSNSQLVHATAKQASGPFTRQGVVLSVIHVVVIIIVIVVADSHVEGGGQGFGPDARGHNKSITGSRRRKLDNTRANLSVSTSDRAKSTRRVRCECSTAGEASGPNRDGEDRRPHKNHVEEGRLSMKKCACCNEDNS